MSREQQPSFRFLSLLLSFLCASQRDSLPSPDSDDLLNYTEMNLNDYSMKGSTLHHLLLMFIAGIHTRSI